MLRLTRVIALLLLVGLASLWGVAWWTRAPGEGVAASFARRLAGLSGAEVQAPSLGGVSMPQGVALGGAFQMTDQAGRAVTQQTYAGGWMLVYFGYSFCPDVCPTELGVMAQAMEELGADAAKVTPILVSIDPERDTPQQLAAYVQNFDPRLQGLTGTPAQLAEMARRYRVYYQKVQRPEMTEYLMDHSSFIYLVGPDGMVRSLFRPETAPEAMAAAIRAQVTRS